jgi:hypothetical protein
LDLINEYWKERYNYADKPDQESCVIEYNADFDSGALLVDSVKNFNFNFNSNSNNNNNVSQQIGADQCD